MSELKVFPLKAANRCHTFEAFVYTKNDTFFFFFLSSETVHCRTPLSLEGDINFPGWYLRFDLMDIGICDAVVGFE